MLSRFVSPAEKKKVLQGLQKGEVDVVIGTHRILSKDVRFKNIGLMIIDEEQRFGVKDKERLKELKTSIDCLTLSATPIPRTLHMSLVKIRDMSLLKTPPSNRRPIETFIQSFEPELVARAIRREVERGGQIFYLHNRVESLEQVQRFLVDLVPEVFVEIAHGRMSARQLEDIMHRFVHGSFQVLVSTTIIENGIDIPNVNTIIIDRADIYGISQLYQLRGRVGRSGRLAYAFLLYPEDREISELAMKRLQVISDFTELGSGFKIAMKDLEVRGAGNLLGAQQSGDVYAVGFDLYLRLLEDAIKERSDEDSEEEVLETYLELDYSGFIPDGYIRDESEKMEVYKKIAAVEVENDLESLHLEMYDRFGPLPDEVHSLISMAELRIICRKLKITNLRERKGNVQITFGKLSIISVDKVMNLMKTAGGRVKLNPARPDGLLMETGDVGLKEKTEFIRERLESLL
ncbi:MAG: transcription-repair coupling factor, partial [Spirochaetes bacterium]